MQSQVYAGKARVSANWGSRPVRHFPFQGAKMKVIRNQLNHGIRPSISSFRKEKDIRFSIEKTPKTLCRRLINILKRTYLSSYVNTHGETVVDARCVSQMEKELGYLPLKSENDNRKAIRKRVTYAFWSNILENCREMVYNECVDFLMKIYLKLDSSSYYGSMTASVCALESLHVAAEDFSKPN